MAPEERPSLLSPWDLLAVAGFAGLAFFYAWITPSLPDPVPTHFDARGIANGWTPRAALPWVIFGIPLLIWTVTFVTGILMSLAQKDPARARAAAMAPMRGLLGLGLSLLMGFILLTPFKGPGIGLAGLGCLLALVVAGIVLMARDFAQVRTVDPTLAFYKWGLFYVNPDDDRIWVPKAIGVGWTLNFAKPASWVVLALLLLPVGVVILLTR
ncbi:DUF5808 domain-containing protein [Mesoterricola silvestris]|uniref:DUF1648 domain-containing protein n=1 Tax=Mesoterricola silvestris TaxID=2927979 RepID=A0AA48GJI0_9BACT|nr:DUF5808 domain-containing protein [Mesoterricola silvestris]BDU72294.1 hypothetical protein METEAL_14680 [Mesoterricola silvestris]